jgi:hypothetical protein
LLEAIVYTNLQAQVQLLSKEKTMAHFAKLDENNIVLAVHVVNNEVITVDGVESEQAGIDFLSELHGHGTWKQCSYNGSIRKNYPGQGWSYDASLDAFIPLKPFESWIINEDTCQWEAPIPKPEGMYSWNEEEQSWIEASI